MEVSQQQKGMDRETLRAAGHNQSRHWRSAPQSIPRLRGSNWRTAFSSKAGLSSLPEIDLEMRNHARDTWKEVFWWLLVKCILSAKGSQTFSSLWNIWCHPGNHHTSTRKILPWCKASIMDNRVEQRKDSESLVSSLKYWPTSASGLPAMLRNVLSM